MEKPITLGGYRELLLANGFKVTDLKTSWFLFEKNGILGYCQKDSFFGLGLHSVNKPDKEFGTGTVVFRHLINPTLEDAEEIVRRQWSDFKTKPYKSLEEYKSHPNNRWAKYSIIYPQ